MPAEKFDASCRLVQVILSTYSSIVTDVAGKIIVDAKNVQGSGNIALA